MEITVQQLKSCGVLEAKAKIYAPIISKESSHFEIVTPMRMAHFLAQILHESGCFKYVKELASGKAYDTGKKALMLGNTPEADGDGQRYPELLEQPGWAVKSAMWFWLTQDLNLKADRDELTNITKRINGGTNGLSQRLALLGKAKRALGLIKSKK